MNSISYLCLFVTHFTDVLLCFVDKRLKTPLHVAAEKNHFELMDVLLKHGAKVNGICSLLVFTAILLFLKPSI